MDFLRGIFARWLHSKPKSKDSGTRWLWVSANAKEQLNPYKRARQKIHKARRNKDLATERSIKSEFANEVTRLKDQLAKPNIETDKAQQIIQKLLVADAYDSITQALKMHAAPKDLFLYAADLVLQQNNYNTAIRMAKEVQDPTIIEPLIQHAVSQNNWAQVENLAQSIKYYQIYYFRRNITQAYNYQQHAYAYAAMACVQARNYDQALQYTGRASRCLFMWDAIVKRTCLSQDYFEIERIADAAGSLRRKIFAQASQLCPVESEWYTMFAERSGTAATAPEQAIS